MSDEGWKAIGSIATLVTVILSLIISLANQVRVKKVAAKLDEVHGQMNGMKTDLMRATGAEAQAVGEAIGREKATAERQSRVVEAERVEDRATEKHI